MALNLAWSRAAVSAVLLALVLAQACGGDSDKPPLPGGSGTTPVGKPVGVGGTAGGAGEGSGATGATGGDAGSGSGDEELRPIVEVTSPEAVSDPNDDGVIVVDELDVVCEARQGPGAGAAPVDPSTVTIELLDADGEVVQAVRADPTGEPDQFSARVIAGAITENGRIGFRCSANDGQLPASTGSDTIYSFIDHGPLIEVEAPLEDDVVAQRGGLVFDFTVLPAPLADGDRGARVDEVLLDVNGVRVDVGEPDDGRYRFTVDLTDRSVFSREPNGEVPLTIRARNRREPEPVERSLAYPITIDGEGPEIAVEIPRDRDVVGSVPTVRFTVEDEASGVDTSSVVVKVGNTEHRFDAKDQRWQRDDSEYTFRFDSTQLESQAKVQALLNVHATDNVGNRSEGQAVLVYFDHVPPIIDLDPGNVREVRESGEALQCSNSFDPVGPRAPNDQQIVTRVAPFRAIVWELTNYTTNQTVLFHSGTKPGSARVYIGRDSSAPLLIDKDGDGVCDDIDVDPGSDENRKNFVPLVPIPRSGSAWYAVEDPAGQPSVTPEVCEFPTTSPTPPDMLCDDESDMWIAIPQYTIPSRPPAIYAIGVGTGPACTGIDWEFGSIAEEGWLCFAARVEDNAGNVGVSRPLRLCYDDVEDGLPPPACATTSTEPPTCTDGCQLPPAFTSSLVEQ